MDNQRKSILDKLFECVNHGMEWGVNQVKNPCPPKKKCRERNKTPPPETELKEEIDSEDEIENKTQIGVGEGSDKFIPFSPCEPKGPYLYPEQICPNWNEPPCCYIPMQDPCRPPCCEPEKKEEPCPPRKSHLDEPRESICGCDHCKKNKNYGRCSNPVTKCLINNGKIKQAELRFVENIGNHYSQELSSRNETFTFGWKTNIFIKVPVQKVEEYPSKQIKPNRSSVLII